MATYYDLKPSYKDSNGNVHTIPTYAVDSVLNTESNNAISNSTVATALQGLQTATGNPATITNAAPINAQSVRVAIEAVQEGSGTPSPDNVRPIVGWDAVNVYKCGKNLFDVSTYPFTDGYSIVGSSGRFIQSNLPLSATEDFIPCSSWQGKTITLNHRPSGNATGFAFYSSADENSYISGETNNNATGGKSWTFDVPSNAMYFRFCVRTADKDEIQLVFSTTAATYTKSLSTTNYGGYWDATEGVIGTTHANIASYNGETLPGAWISDRDEYTEGGTPTTGAQVVYEIATPTTASTTPEEIPLSQGINNLWSDTGDVTTKFWSNNIIGQLVGLIQQSQS